MVFRGRFAEWNQRTIIALESMHHRLSPEHKITLERFKGARNQTLLFRAINILRAGIYRQTLLGNLGLVVAVVLKKI